MYLEPQSLQNDKLLYGSFLSQNEGFFVKLLANANMNMVNRHCFKMRFKCKAFTATRAHIVGT